MNFSGLIEVGKAAGLETVSFTTQMDFLIQQDSGTTAANGKGKRWISIQGSCHVPVSRASIAHGIFFDVNIERTIEFILESQARAEIRTEKAEIRTEKAEGRIERLEIRMEKAETRAVERERKLDRRMEAVTRLIQQGMKTLARTQVQIEEIAQSQKELAQAQKETERTLKAFIASSRNGKGRRNGH